MGTWADVRALALGMPGAVEDATGATTAWRVGSRAFAWERILRPGELGLRPDCPPGEPVLGLRVPDAAARAAWLAELPQAFFLVPHYEPYPMVLVDVRHAPFEALDEAVTEAWLSRAPQRAVRAYLAADLPSAPASSPGRQVRPPVT